MEFSCYHFHSNRLARIYTFIKDKDNFLVKTIKVRDIDSEYDEIEFMINEKVLKSIDILYDTYKLSLLFTKDTKNLIETDRGFGVYNLKNWKGLYLSKDYTFNYMFDCIPTELEMPENNQNNFNEFMLDIEDKETYCMISTQNANAFKMYENSKQK